MNARERVVHNGLSTSSIVCVLAAALVSGCEDTQAESHADAGPSSARDASRMPDSAAPGLPEPKISVSVVLDPGPDEVPEAYVCLTTPIRDAGNAQIQRVAWFPPASRIALHHASLYAATGSLPDGPLPCDPLPELVATLGIYTPGSDPLTLPPDVAVELPEETSHLYFSAHIVRLEPGPVAATRVELGLVDEPALHAAQWVDIFAEVPPIPPHEQRTSVGSCRFLNDAHAVTVWGHMHRAGRRFVGTLVRADGARETLLEIPRWDFDHQPVYPIDVRIEAGDTVETRCEWSNDGDRLIESGSFTDDEMCNQGLFVWPPEGTHCVPSP
jgi:hypothetical protein